jgi:hypothetical protein
MMKLEQEVKSMIETYGMKTVLQTLIVALGHEDMEDYEYQLILDLKAGCVTGHGLILCPHLRQNHQAQQTQ